MMAGAVRLRAIIETWWPRVLALVPAVLSIWFVNRTGTYRTLLFDGGWTTRFYVLAWIVLTPYLGWLIMATGRVTFSLIKHEATQRVDEFFVGAATLILTGFGLGALSILYPQIVLGFATAVLLWDSRDLRKPRKLAVTLPLVATSLLGLWLLATVFLDRAVIPDVVSTDVQQLYAPYLAEVARNHSIWLAADNPIFSDFEIGHGNGLHLIMATFLPPHVAQIISFLYFVGIGAVIFELARTLVPLRTLGRRWEDAAPSIALGFAILALASDPGPQIMEFGKYHLQTAAFLLYFLLIVVRPSKGQDKLSASLCGLALAASYPLFAAFAFLISGVGVLTKALQRDWRGLATSVALGSGAVAGCMVAFGVNYLYLGIPATNPYSIFRHVVSVDRFSHFGSLDILDYFVVAQSIGVSDFSIEGGLLVAFRQMKAIIRSAALLAMTCCVVAFLDSKLFPNRSGHPKSWPPLNVAAPFILIAYLVTVRSLDATLKIPSLIRLSIHVHALTPVVVIAIAFAGLTIVWRLAPTWFTGRTAPHLAFLALFFLCASTVYWFPWQSFKSDGAVRFVTGRPLNQMPRVSLNWQRCDELQQSTGSERILPLNGYRAMVPCYFSPLLTRGKIIHTYQSDVARDFKKIALGTAETAEAALRALGVDLFYVQKENCDFWLNGFSDLFQKDELARRFAVRADTPDYWLLSWKNGDQALSPEAEAEISALRTRSKEIYREAYGVEPFEVVKHRLSLDGKRTNPERLDQLSKCR
ncbi:hypothetical protein [Bradyrhizobium sp. DOA9]|uniref:hypothetical protein n=1 Tax=Bradyrhizobium sp. DOA9 TaxID=1126627 RepID=UPI000AC06137|nr:hypothetical protein [Bradyrhizobium sp. DOA9]